MTIWFILCHRSPGLRFLRRRHFAESPVLGSHTVGLIPVSQMSPVVEFFLAIFPIDNPLIFVILRVFFTYIELICEQFDLEKKQLLADVEAERSHHQKMLKDYDRLQQRFENLQGEVEILQSPTMSPIKDTRMENGKQHVMVFAKC